MKVTTFHVQLESVDKSSGVTFNRTDMEASATSTYDVNYFTVKSYDHTIPAQTTEEQNE